MAEYRRAQYHHLLGKAPMPDTVAQCVQISGFKGGLGAYGGVAVTPAASLAQGAYQIVVE